MTSLIRLTFILIVLCAGAIAAIALLDHMHPLSSAVLFTNPDGTPCARPCLLGIRPGETSRAEALAILRAHPLTRSLDPNLEGDIFHDQAIGLILIFNCQEQVSTIRLAEHPDATVNIEGTLLDQVVHLASASDLVVQSVQAMAMCGAPVE